MKPCAVYYLVDPRTKEPRYVGVSVNPTRRLIEKHCRPVATNHKENWIRDLLDRGLLPIQRIICLTTCIFARELERKLIATVPNLTNATAGGDGLCDPTLEIRKKMGDSCRQGWASRKGQPTAKKGKPWSSKKRAAFELRKAAGPFTRRNPITKWSEKRRERYLTNPPRWKCANPSPLKGKPSGRKGIPWTQKRREAQERK